ncbi:hypothetical protein E2C01_045929 [Portunus trituberculatus]|uniref:Uncharacterized protein n=1 Tax=Portunus trituberculatus TaxID=210409 RepID=A0A5B7G398_PORTR|nr:hypothetical protein [Portunus trituberculatus]
MPRRRRCFMFLKRNMTEEERAKMRELATEVTEKNEARRLECMERDKPDIICIVETKLRLNIQVDWFGDGNHRLWRKDRMKKSAGGINVLKRKDLTVKNISLGGEEVVGLVVTDGRQDINIVTVYVPPNTSARPNEQYDDMVRSTIQRMKIEVAIKDKSCFSWRFQLQRSHVGRVQSGEWGEQLLGFAMENLLTQ